MEGFGVISADHELVAELRKQGFNALAGLAQERVEWLVTELVAWVFPGEYDSAAIFAKYFFEPPARKIGKNHAATLAFGCPSRPATLATSLCDVAAQMTGRDVGMLCNFTLRLWHGREIAQP